jgi:hypothetical protein
VKLSKYFSTETDPKLLCGCGCVAPDWVIRNLEQVCHQADKIREQLGSPVSVNSGYRCKAYNKSIGGALFSQHCKGTALDLNVNFSGAWALAIWNIATRIPGIGGVGIYDTFCHIDTRPRLLARVLAKLGGNKQTHWDERTKR